MLTTKQLKIKELRECIDMLESVDVKQQRAFEGKAMSWDNHNALQSMIEDFEAEIKELLE